MDITVTFPDGATRQFPRWTTVDEIFKSRPDAFTSPPPIAAVVNNEITSRSYKVDITSRVAPITLQSREGMNLYRRSLCYLLACASRRVFRERRLVIGHSLGKGYFYEYDGMAGVPEEDLKKLARAMVELVAADLPIERINLSYDDAVRHFKEANQPDTVLLLQYRNEAKIAVNVCDGFIDIFHAPLVPCTGALTSFGLKPYPPGFILRYPPLAAPEGLAVFEDNPILFGVYREYKSWGKILNINCIGRLNRQIETGQIREFIDVAEALHDKKIAEIADRIRKRFDRAGAVLIAGPSSSGKTTFSKKLAIQLKVLGLDPVALSLDNYYLPRSATPLDEEGKPDFESLRALNLERLNRNLARLLAGKATVTPIYDFVTGAPKPGGVEVRPTPHSLFILEGIHGLNDELTSGIPADRKYKIYVSALTQLNLDDHNRIPTTDVRLIRRLVRDYSFRGYRALDTLRMWPSVRRGEDRNIFPFQNNADTAFNSSLDYELAVLKVYVERLLKTIKPDVEEYSESRRLLAFLNNVISFPSTFIPDKSILREFIGQSAFSY
ncbi:MAG: nucleoside kinase [Spirochaetales bacterium]|nr:nucleoside kinase [Spirochaetales bacterium]